MSKTEHPPTSDVSVTEVSDGVYYTQHDMDTNGLTVTIAIAMSEITGLTHDELIPDFSEYADPCALDSLFRTRPNGEHRKSGGKVTLHIQEYAVSIFSNGDIKLEAEESDDS